MKNGKIYIKLEELLGIDYIPLPLSDTKQLEYIEELNKGNIEARDILVLHNLKIIMLFLKKYAYHQDQVEDLFMEGVIGLIKGIETFDINRKRPLFPYLSKCIENEMLLFLRKNKRFSDRELYPNNIVDEENGIEINYFETLENKTINIEQTVIDNVMLEEIFEILKKFPKKKQEIFLNYFGFNKENKPISQRKLIKMYSIGYMTITKNNKQIMDEILNQLFIEDKVKKYEII